MRRVAALAVAFSSVSLMLVSGCSDEPAPTGTVTIQLPQTACPEVNPDALVLTNYEACSFAVSILNGPWVDSRPESLFDSGCLRYSGDLVTVSGFPAGAGMTVHLEAFRDPNCNDKALLGLRGGVTVIEGEDSGGIWYVPTFQRGGFTPFPQFRQDTLDAAAATSCDTNEECRAKKADGGYVVSPSAICDTDAGKCRLPATTFPLNMGSARAFHSATTLDDGKVVLVGGVAREVENGKFIATDETVEVFDPITVTWSKPNIDGLSGLRMAAHAAVSTGGSSIGVFGGARQLNLAVVDTGEAGANKKYLQIGIPSEDNSKTDNILDLAFAVELASGRADVGTLVKPRAALNAVRTPEGVLVTGGLEAVENGTGGVASVVADTCTAGAGHMTCEAAGALTVPRLGHCSFCLSESAGVCSEIMLFGGLSTADEAMAETAIAETYKDGNFQKVGLLPSEAEGNVVWPSCARASGNNYLVGGAPRNNKPPEILPSLLANTQGGSKVGAVGLTGAGGTVSPFRTFSRGTALEAGRLLVTGGLDDNGNAVRSAYLVEGETIIDQKNMVVPRFGHTATLITRGPLKGAVLIVGGFTTNEGKLEAVNTAELFIP